MVCNTEFQSTPYRLKHGIDRCCSKKCEGELKSQNRRGENNYNYRGGLSTLAERIRTNRKYIDWRTKIFKRDGFIDQITKRPILGSGNARVHHIIPFVALLRKYKITTLEEALVCDPLWDMSNGITVSKETHDEIHKKMGRGGRDIE